MKKIYIPLMAAALVSGFSSHSGCASGSGCHTDEKAAPSPAPTPDTGAANPASH